MPAFDVTVRAQDAALEGTLTLPDNPAGIIVFAHGSGSSRFSPRNRLVAGALVHGGLATLLFDLLTGATHLFEEPGKLAEVTRLAYGWFQRHLAARHDREPGASAARSQPRAPER